MILISRRISLYITGLLLGIFFTYGEACTRTRTLPVNDLVTTQASSETTATTESTESTTVKTTTKSTITTTTTKKTMCDSVIPLITTGIPADSEEQLDFIPSDTAPLGSSITVHCLSINPTELGTQVFVQYDSGGLQQQDSNNYFDTSFEMFKMTCQPSGLWNVAIVSPTGPVSGTVSGPGNIFCVNTAT